MIAPVRRLSLLARLVIGVPSAFVLIFTAPVVAREDFPDSLKWWRDQVDELGGERLQTGLLAIGILGVLIAVLWSRLLPGPRLVGGDFVEFTRDALGGPGFQVLGVDIYNKRDSGGERRTARGVVPEMVAFDSQGERVAECQGNWFPDIFGRRTTAVDFRPTRERHAVELVGKFPQGTDAWLAGEKDPPSLAPGIYKIRATLRGGNLRKPRRLEWFVRNPGTGGQLTVSNDRSELQPVPDPELPPGDAPDEASDETTPASEALAPSPPSDPVQEISALLVESEDLEEELWERNKRMRRSGSPFPSLGHDYLQTVRAWNARVLAVADAHLSTKEASKVAALVGLSSLFPSAEAVEDLLNDNRAALERVLRRLQ
jgi:hypothetical protein